MQEISGVQKSPIGLNNPVDAGFIGILATTQDDMTDPEESDASVKSEARASLQAELSTS